MADYTPKEGITHTERLREIEIIVGRMELRLFGNGQPGELSSMKGRIDKLEEWRWKLAGGIAMLIAIAEFLRKP